MALFNKPPAKKPKHPPTDVKSAISGVPRTPISAREVAVQAQGRRGAGNERPRAEPAGDITVTGASLIEWSPIRTSIEVAQANPGLCPILENAALLFAGGQSQPARAMLEQGIEADHETRHSQLSWLALFDLHERSNDRAAFDQLALQYVVQFERSAPPWEESDQRDAAAAPKAPPAGYIAITGKLTAATAPQIEALRRAITKNVAQARLDLAAVAGFDDAGARMLADALAEARKRHVALSLERSEKVRTALDILIKRGKGAGEGIWLLSLELLQFEFRQQAFEDRAIEYAIAFEQSPPSWEPPPASPAKAGKSTGERTEAAVDHVAGGGETDGVESIKWSGVMAGPSAKYMAQVSDFAHSHPVVPIDLSDLDRIDFVCAGALLNVINRVESQRKAVQILGASPIIRVLLLLIGIPPRHFLKKAS
ncbi:MAG: STAS domain-containing protein [Vicinamibacterales bacterium]